MRRRKKHLAFSQNTKDEIFKEYLYKKKELDLSTFDLDNYDIGILCYAFNCGLSLKDDSIAFVVKELIVYMINLWKSNENKYCSKRIPDVYAIDEVMDFLQRELTASETQTSIVLDILFTEIDFSKFTNEAIKFYLSVFGTLLIYYFDSFSDRDKRTYCEEIITLLENKITMIKEERVKIELYKSLILAITFYGTRSDWSKLPSGYSYQDKQFLNCLFSKYGGYHLKDMLHTIDKLHLDELLPEVLLSVRDAFRNASLIKLSGFKTFKEIVREEELIIMLMLSKAFLDLSDSIKQDDDLTNALEEILEMLVELDYEVAATILDEFRIQ